MANRVLLGNRATGGYGLYVSKTGENVLDTANAMAFDSRTGTGWTIQSWGQGTISTSQGNEATVALTHNLGYNPLFVVRWCTANEITSNVATKVFTPRFAHTVLTTGGSEPEISDSGYGCSAHHHSTSTITVTAYGVTIYYSYIIFNEPDFTGGLGL